MKIGRFWLVTNDAGECLGPYGFWPLDAAPNVYTHKVDAEADADKLRHRGATVVPARLTIETEKEGGA